MNTKLTLTIEQELIEKAKEYAREQGRSLSDIVQNYFKVITTNAKSKKAQEADELPAAIKALYGSFTAPKDFDYKKELSKARDAKLLK